MVARMTSRGWIISHRCSWITVYAFCRNAQSESHSDPHDICTLYLFYQPSMLLFILWRDTTSELWTLVQFPLHCYTVYFHSHCLLSWILLPFYHMIRSILCLQQTCEIDNLIVSWGKVLGCVVCRFHIAAGAKQSPGRGAI
jgi:hypothetical protein